MDERCVLCQYVVQRTLKALETKVVDDFTVFDNRPASSQNMGGFPGLSQMAGRTGVAERPGRAKLISNRYGLASRSCSIGYLIGVCCAVHTVANGVQQDWFEKWNPP